MINEEKEKQKLILCLNKAKIKKGQFKDKNIEAGEDLLAGCRNIWDYIQFQQLLKKTMIPSQNKSDQIDGIYFKFQITKDGQKQQKRLQTFSQTLTTGCKTLVITTIRDMSHWIEFERQKNLTLLKTQAFASAAHEFRNPLSAIITSLDLMDEYIDKNQVGQYYQTAKSCSNLMLYLVNDILDYSQLESQKLQMNPEEVNIERLIQECIDILKFRADQKGLNLTYEVQSRFPLRFLTDQNRLRQIIINLVSNGIKYTHQGFVKVSATFNNILQKIQIEVEDSGVGIDECDQAKLFNAYCKIMKNRDLNKEGCGLGLTISKNLAQALGGCIKLQSKVGRGSKFFLELPYNIMKEDFKNFRKSLFQNKSRLMTSNDDIHLEFQEPLSIQNFDRQSSIQQAIQSFQMRKYSRSTPRRSEYHVVNPDQMRSENILDDSQTNLRQDFNQQVREYLQTNEYNFLQEDIDESSQRQINVNHSHDLEGQLENIELMNQNDNHTNKGSMEIFEKDCSHAKVLVIDDDPFNTIILQGLLQQLKIPVVDRCFDGITAIEKIEENYSLTFECSFHTPGRSSNQCKHHEPYQLVIVDNQMPQVTGIEVGQILRQKQERGELSKNMKIMLLSGDDRLLNNEELETTFDFIALKPIRIQYLKDILQKVKII
eukprot:403343505